jgi:hypothetical protein
MILKATSACIATTTPPATQLHMPSSTVTKPLHSPAALQRDNEQQARNLIKSRLHGLGPIRLGVLRHEHVEAVQRGAEQQAGNLQVPVHLLHVRLPASGIRSCRMHLSSHHVRRATLKTTLHAVFYPHEATTAWAALHQAWRSPA